MTAVPTNRPLWHWMVLSATLPLIAIIIGAQTGRWVWMGELASHWTLHATIGLLPVVVLFRRDPWWGRLFLILLLVGCWPWLRSSFSSRAHLQPDQQAVGSLTLATANIQATNADRDALYKSMESWSADVLILIEVTSADRDALQSQKNWPHQHWQFGHGPFSLAVLSKFRIVDKAILRMNDIAALDVLIDTGEAPLRLFPIHPTSPVSPEHMLMRNRYLAMVAQSVQETREPVVIAGDWNVTQGAPLWSPLTSFAEVLRPPGPQPATWPSWLGPLGIGIDHIVGRNVGLAPLEVFSIPGSDHRGLRTTVTMPSHW